MIPLQTGANVITVSATDNGGAIATDTLTVNFDALTYYLAEGSTGFFLRRSRWRIRTRPARASVTFLKDDGSTVVQAHTLPPTSQKTIRVTDVAGLEAMPLSTIVSSLDMLPLGVERTMSWDATSYGGSGGEAIGQPRLKWMFAEGAQGFFQDLLDVAEPERRGDDRTVTFLPERAAVRSSASFRWRRCRGSWWTPPRAGACLSVFGFVVEATQPIVAERAMYFGNTPSIVLAGGHVSVGAPDPSTSWFFAEGATGFLRHVPAVQQPWRCPGACHADLSARQRAGGVGEQDCAGARAADGVVENEAPELAAAAFRP